MRPGTGIVWGDKRAATPLTSLLKAAKVMILNTQMMRPCQSVLQSAGAGGGAPDRPRIAAHDCLRVLGRENAGEAEETAHTRKQQAASRVAAPWLQAVTRLELTMDWQMPMQKKNTASQRLCVGSRHGHAWRP